MVKDRRATPSNAIRQRQLGRQSHRFGIQGTVQTPPKPIQDLREIRHGNPWVQSPGERGIKVMVQIDQPGHDHPAGRVYPLGIGIGSDQLLPVPHGLDALTAPHHRTVCEHWARPIRHHGGVAGQQNSIWGAP